MGYTSGTETMGFDMDRLSAMIRRQWLLQEKLGELPGIDASNEDRLTYLRNMHLALGAEMHEAMQETGWKPWASSDHINEAAAFAELCDAWQFLMNCFFAVAPRGMTPDQIAMLIYKTHADKVEVNLRRYAEGYDGVKGKCPVCKRAYDDPAVTCRPGRCSTFEERLSA